MLSENTYTHTHTHTHTHTVGFNLDFRNCVQATGKWGEKRHRKKLLHVPFEGIMCACVCVCLFVLRFWFDNYLDCGKVSGRI